MRNFVNYSDVRASREIESRNGRINRSRVYKINKHIHVFCIYIYIYKRKNAFFLNYTEPPDRGEGERG